MTKKEMVLGLLLFGLLISGCSALAPRAMCKVSQPYISHECQQENISYSITNRVDGQSPNTCPTCQVPLTFPLSSCVVNNLDSVGGTFTIYVSLGYGWCPENCVGENITKYIYPQSSETFEFIDYQEQLKNITHPDNVGVGAGCSEVNIPTKQVCKDVTKYQIVEQPC